MPTWQMRLLMRAALTIGGPFLDCPRQRLLHVHVLAGVESVDGDDGMPVIRHADEDGIEFFDLEQLAVIAEGFGVGRVFFRQVDLRRVDVAQGRDIHVAGLDEVPHVACAARAAAHDAELDAFIGAENARIGERGGGGSAAKERTARYVGGRHRPIIMPLREAAETERRFTFRERGPFAWGP